VDCKTMLACTLQNREVQIISRVRDSQTLADQTVQKIMSR